MNLQRRHDAGEYIEGFERVLDRQCIHYRREHSHVVAGDTVHAGARETLAAKYVPAANDDRNLGSGLLRCANFRRDALDDPGLDAVVQLAHQGLAAEFQQDALAGWWRLAHGLISP